MKLFTGVVYTCLGIVSAIVLGQAILAWTNPLVLPGVGGGAISYSGDIVSINQLKITGGTPGTGKVLTSDTVGLATWTTPASGLPTGTTTQTLRHNGTAWIANSVLINDGTNIGVSGNINLSGATPTYKVTNLIAPTAAADAATKGYVDAFTPPAGSGSLMVYRSDGTTLLGTYSGIWSTTPTTCSGWGYFATGGGLRVLAEADCTLPATNNLWYTTTDCSGSAYAPTGALSAITNFGNTYLKGTCDPTRSAASYRSNAGTCTVQSSTACYQAVTSPAIVCGSGSCVVK
jgi:hypothetical protein